MGERSVCVVTQAVAFQSRSREPAVVYQNHDELKAEGQCAKLAVHAPNPQVLEAWQQIALPFIKRNPALKLPVGAEGYSLFQWCTAIVASYSFTIGDDLFQV